MNKVACCSFFLTSFLTILIKFLGHACHKNLNMNLKVLEKLKAVH